MKTKPKSVGTMRKPTKKQLERYLKQVPHDVIDKPGYVDLILKQMFSSAVDNRQKARHPRQAEIDLALQKCAMRGLNPLLNEIYFIYRYNKKINDLQMFEHVGIEGLRMIADRRGQYIGSDAAKYKTVSLRKTTSPDIRCKMTVYRLNPKTGEPFPTSAVVFMSEFKWLMGYVGNKMPKHKLGLIAEAQALRKAFRIGQVYITEELPPDDPTKVEAKVETVQSTIDETIEFLNKKGKK